MGKRKQFDEEFIEEINGASSGEENNKITDSEIVNELNELKKRLSKPQRLVLEQIEKIISKISKIDHQLNWIDEEIEKLRIQKIKAEKDKKYQLAKMLGSAILGHLRMAKNLYESRADIEQTLQQYMKMLTDIEIKTSELKLKAWERFKKDKETDDKYKQEIVKVVQNLVNSALKKSEQLIMESSPDITDSENRKSERDKIRLPNEFKL